MPNIYFISLQKYNILVEILESNILITKTNVFQAGTDINYCHVVQIP